MVSVRGGQAGLLDKPPHREATVNTDTVITATTLAAQEGDEMISTYHSYSGGYYSKVVRNNVSAQNASCAFSLSCHLGTAGATLAQTSI